MDIVPGHSVERALRESEDRFRAIAEAASDWFWEMDSELRFVYISERFYEVTGQSPELVLGRTRREVAARFGADLDSGPWRRHLEDLEGHRPFRNFEYVITDPQGRRITIHLNGKPRFAADGSFLGFIGSGTDVTPRVEAEAAQRQTVQELEAIFNNASVGIIYTSHSNILQRCNSRAAEILGYAQVELIGQSGVSIFPDVEAYKAFVKASAPTLLAGRAFSDEGRLKRKDGNPVWCHFFARPIDPEYTDRGIVWILEDIEERRASQEQLGAALRQFEAIMTNASIGILLTRDRKMLRHNPKFGEMFGFHGSSAVGLPGRALYRSDEEYAEVGRLATPLLSKAQPFQTELFMRRQDGTDLWVNLIGYVTDPADATRGTIWIMEDRTAFKRVDDALRRTLNELEGRVAERTAELTQQLHFMQQLIEAIPGPMFYKDTDARYLGCNRAFAELVGRPVKELVGKTPHDVAPPELAEKYLAADREILDNPGTQIYEGRVRDAGGVIRDVMFHKASFTLADGQVGGLVGVMLDITQRKKMEDDLRQAATVFESAAEGVTITRPDGEIIAVNRAFTEITGYEAEEVVGHNPRILQSGVHGKDFYRAMWRSIIDNGRWLGEVWNKRKNGEVFPEQLSVTAVKDINGKVLNYVATFTDITVQKENEERIQQLAFSDPLTGLPNRRLLLDRLQHALASRARDRQYGALFFIDLDDFKDLNDTLGHDMGDMLLQLVAQRLKDCVRESDTIARIGGDEFVVILEELSASVVEAGNQAEVAGTKILSALNEVYRLGEHLHHSTPSIGITLFDDSQSSVDELLKQADLAMYQAKDAGRNALRFFDPEMQNIVEARVSMEKELRLGLKAGQFILHYQPQLDYQNRIIGAEALIRWQHPQRGMVSPLEFIPVAEDTGLILPIGQWVLQMACSQLALWARRAETADLILAVNVSARQFRHPEFVDQVLSTVDGMKADPTRLKIELTESLLLDNVEEIIARMTALKARGIRFSLDDFGTGYSSLAYLKRLPLDQLKIDQSFVRDILSDPNDASIARTIVALANGMGLEVIAEGVETEAQRFFLASHGCNAYQGYLFSRPLPIDEFEDFLAKRLAA
ncbi:MAG: PAS domain S-box protein [Sulfuritalea sp.]|nr:PAS domain S-box protein [Sulfuritalea sp.]